MKIKLLITSLFLLLFSIGVYAQGTEEPYVVIDQDGTATFFYDANKPTGALPLQSSNYDVNWPENIRESVKKVVFHKSFNDCKPTSYESWFYNFSNLTEITGMKEYLHTENVTDMSSMFSYCLSLTTLDLSNFKTANVTSMYEMFMFTTSLTTLDLSNFNTENVTNMAFLFSGCKSLTTLDISSFVTTNVKFMYHMFSGCSSLTTLDLYNFNTENVSSVYSMFLSCNSLKTLELSTFNTANVTDMLNMFKSCSELESIFVGDGWTTAAAKTSVNMFDGCAKLCGGKGTAYTPDYTDAAYAHIDGGEENPGYLTKSTKKTVVSIEVTTSPKTEYTEGDDFSAENGILTLTYNTGDKETVNLSEATITGYDKTKVGEQTLKIEYQGVENSLLVTVEAKEQNNNNGNNDNPPTPVSSVDSTPGVKVWSSNRSIFIESAPDTKYTIIDLNGRIIKSSTTKSTREHIKINKSGIVVVIINSESFKISL